MQIKTTLLYLALCLWLVPLFAQAQSRYIDAEDAVYANRRIEDNGRSYEWSLQSTNVKPLIDNTYSRKGNHSVKVQMKPGDGYGRSECQYTPYAKTLYSEDQWFGMSVRFDKNFPVPNKWFIFAQWWQGSPMSPSIALMARVNGESEYGIGSNAGTTPEMYIRVLEGQWDADGDGQDARDDVQPLRVGAFKPIPRGEWMDLVVNWKGGSDGYVRVWKDGAVWAEYYGQVGYSNKSKAIKVKWGVYRSGSNRDLSTTIWYDQVRVGKSYEEVDPSREGTYTPPPSTIVSGSIYELEPQCAPGKRLDVVGARSANNTNIQIYQQNGGDNQRWKIINQGNGYYELEPQCASGKRLDVAGARSDNNTNVQIYEQNGGNNQRWKFILKGSNARTVSENAKSQVEEASVEQLQVYPNPAQYQLRVQLLNIKQAAHLTIYTLQGKRLLHQVVSSESEVDVSSLSPGLYLVNLQQNGHTVRRKLLIE